MPWGTHWSDNGPYTFRFLTGTRSPTHRTVGHRMPPSCLWPCKGPNGRLNFFFFSRETVLGVLAGTFPSHRCFCFGFLLKRIMIFSTSPTSPFSTMLCPLLCVKFYCFSTYHSHFCVLTVFTHSSHLSPIIYIFYFSRWRNGCMMKGKGKENSRF